MLSPSNHSRFAVLLSSAFLLLSCFFVLFHELWMDEAYHYLLARDSHSLGQLFANGSRTGHPLLWNLVLYLYKFLFPGIAAMQILHCLIAAFCIFLISRYAPFGKPEKIMIAFGYFFLYEYNLIAKNYILGFCLVMAAMALYQAKKPFRIVAVLLALACSLHLFMLFVALSLFLYFVVQKEDKRYDKNPLLSVAVMVIGLLCAAMQILPSAGHLAQYADSDAPSFFSLDRLGRSLGVLCRGLLNIPDFSKTDYWNSNLFFNLNRISCYLLSFATMLIIGIGFRRHQKILLLFFMPVFAIMAFVYLMPLATGVRYWGYSYVMLIICFWLYTREQKPEGYMALFFRAVLGIQVLVAIPALFIDYSRPFSNAKYAAEIIKREGLSGKTLFVQLLGLGPSLSAYTGQQVYYPASKNFSSFSYEMAGKALSAGEFLDESQRDLERLHLKDAVLVMKEPLSMADASKPYTCRIDEISVPAETSVTYEDYYLYLISRPKP